MVIVSVFSNSVATPSFSFHVPLTASFALAVTVNAFVVYTVLATSVVTTVPLALIPASSTTLRCAVWSAEKVSVGVLAVGR